MWYIANYTSIRIVYLNLQIKNLSREKENLKINGGGGIDQMRKNNNCVTHEPHQTVQEILDMNEECKTQRVGQ